MKTAEQCRHLNHADIQCPYHEAECPRRYNAEPAGRHGACTCAREDAAVRHVYTLTGAEVRRYTEYYKQTEQFVVIHGHTGSQECDGNCPIYNAPNEDE